MGYYGKLEAKQRAIILRGKGFSYKEILLQIPVSKDTLSRWCRNVVLTNAQKEQLLAKKMFGQRKGSLIAAENKRQKRIFQVQTIYSQSQKEVGALSTRDRFIAGITLYAGEGNKTQDAGLSNADPKIIRFMMDWFREFCHVPESKFRGNMWLHAGRDEAKAREFWSSITGISVDQFRKTYFAIDKLNSRKIRKNIHEYGVFSIRFSDARIHRQILGWISALFDGTISDVPYHSPVAQR